MAEAICNGDTNPLVFEQAVIIAENEVILRSVRAEGIALIERLRDISAKPLSRKHNTILRAKMRFRTAKLQYKLLVQARTEKAALNNGKERDATANQEKDGAQLQLAKKHKPIKSRDEFDAMRQAMPDLDRLARYERRAWSRRKRAVRDFLDIKARSDF